MKKMCFPTWVKYNGEKYPPHTAFEVCDKDVTDLQKAGGWIIEPPVKETPIPEVLVKDETLEEPVVPKKKRSTKAKKQEE